METEPQPTVVCQSPKATAAMEGCYDSAGPQPRDEPHQHPDDEHRAVCGTQFTSVPDAEWLVESIRTAIDNAATTNTTAPSRSLRLTSALPSPHRQE
jgi:hypothetical protein